MKLVVTLAAALVATSAFASEPPAATSKGDPKKAEPIVTQLCAGCHAADGNSAAAANPKLAGLNSEYIYKQLSQFKSGDRKNAVMSGMVAGLSDDDMKNLAAYYAMQQPKGGTAKDKDLAMIGKKIYHGGVQGKGIPVQFPRLAGQHSDYIYSQLNLFRTGARANDGAKMMRTIAAKMTDSDMKAVSAYIQGLR